MNRFKKKAAGTGIFMGKTIVILLLGSLLGVLLLTLSFLLPGNTVHLQESRALIDGEAWYPAVPQLSAGMYFESFLPGVLDNSSDYIMLATAMDDSEGNPLVRAMDMYSEYSGKYSYYWHGYVSILRPLTLLFNYSEIRVINGLLQLFLVAVFFGKIKKQKGLRYGVLFLASYALMMPMALGVALQYSWVFYITIFGCMVLTGKEIYWQKKHRLLYLFLILGMLTSYFDLLTYPLVTWGIPLVWYLLTASDEKKSLGWLGRVVSTGVMWIVGYGGMWAMKWIIGSRVLGRDILQQAIDEIFLRAGVEDQAVWNTRWNAIWVNWKHYEYKIYMLILMFWLAWLFYRSVRYGWKTDGRCGALMLIAVSPFVWYIVLTNHTAIHHLFTYRIYNISILAVLGAVLLCLAEKKQAFSLKSLLQNGVNWVGVLVLACFLLLFSQEDRYVFNGECAGRNVLLPEGETLVSEFYPSYSKVTQIRFWILTESTEGSYLVELYEDGEVVDQRHIPMEKVKEQYYYSVDVDWKLDMDKQYELNLTALNGNADSYVLAANAGEALLPEFGEIFTVGDTMEAGQIVMGINYRYPQMPSGKTFVFYMMSYVLVSILPVLVSGSVWEKWRKRMGKFHRS